MLGASTNLGSQRCRASNGEALLKIATELIGIIQVQRNESTQGPLAGAGPCGSWLASDEINRVHSQTGSPASRASPLPHNPIPVRNGLCQGLLGRFNSRCQLGAGLGRVSILVVHEVGDHVEDR